MHDAQLYLAFGEMLAIVDTKEAAVVVSMVAALSLPSCSPAGMLLFRRPQLEPQVLLYHRFSSHLDGRLPGVGASGCCGGAEEGGGRYSIALPCCCPALWPPSPINNIRHGSLRRDSHCNRCFAGREPAWERVLTSLSRSWRCGRRSNHGIGSTASSRSHSRRLDGWKTVYHCRTCKSRSTADSEALFKGKVPYSLSQGFAT